MGHRRSYNSSRHWPDGEYRLLASCPPRHRKTLMRQFMVQMPGIKLRYITGRDGKVHIYKRMEVAHE